MAVLIVNIRDNKSLIKYKILNKKNFLHLLNLQLLYLYLEKINLKSF